MIKDHRPAQLYEASIIILCVVIAVCAIVGVVSSKVSGPDAPLEEAAEAYIESSTGIDLDLSPGTPEKD